MSFGNGQPIPGPDPGACPDCGRWRRAGMRHECSPAAPEPFLMPALEKVAKQMADDVLDRAAEIRERPVGEIPLRKVGEDESGEPVYQRVMTADEIRERAQLNVQRTTETLRLKPAARSELFAVAAKYRRAASQRLNDRLGDGH